MRRCVIGFVAASIMFGDTKVAFSSLPRAVQIAAKRQANGATIVGATKEVEKGRTTYEVETKADGKSRDLTFDKAGNLLTAEQEVALDSLPTPAFEAIQRRTAGRTIKKVESITLDNSVSYEVTVTTKSGKNAEIAVNSDGSPRQD
jgi:uncharacterized membrane protein YkoI